MQSDLKDVRRPGIEPLSRALETHAVTSVDLVTDALDRAADSAGEGNRTFTRIYRERAIVDAARSDRRIGAGRRRSVLEGLPISIKDLCDVAGEPTTAGAAALVDAAPAARDAVVVERLRSAGGVIVGKTNMTEFAFSGLGLNPHFGNPRAPWQRALGRIAGGSSSGAAVSVADGMAVAAIGSDTGGSIRTPAAFCGIVGFKPSASRVSRHGCFELSESLDSIGPLANSVACCRVVDAIIADQPLPGLPPSNRGRAPRFALAGAYALDTCDPVVSAAFERAMRSIEEAGASLVDIKGNPFARAGSLVATGSFATFEGWRRHATLLERIGPQMDDRVARRFFLGKEQSEDLYAELCAIRAALIADARRAMSEVDAVLLPTVPILPPREEELSEYDDYVRLNGLALRNTAIGNFIDGCAVTIPCSEPGEAPVGLSLMGLNGWDRRIFAAGEWVEAVLRATGRTASPHMSGRE